MQPHIQTQSAKRTLTQEQIDFFHEEGYLYLEGFYDLDKEIKPIQYGIYQLIKLLIAKYDLPIEQLPFAPETFDDGYQALIKASRSYGGEIYDAVKQIPAFMRLVASEVHEDLLKQIRGTDMPAVAAGGYGIRIDNPNEAKFRAPWHQEYPAQFRSMDGVVYWAPLAEMTEDMGPVVMCPKSHKGGLVRVHTKDPKNPEKTGAYALILENEEQLVNSYEQIAPLSKPGDLFLMDFLTLHQSGLNSSKRSRWSMQSRLFNFRDPTGMKIKWAGGFAAGTDLKAIHPDLYID